MQTLEFEVILSRAKHPFKDCLVSIVQLFISQEC